MRESSNEGQVLKMLFYRTLPPRSEIFVHINKIWIPVHWNQTNNMLGPIHIYEYVNGFASSA